MGASRSAVAFATVCLAGAGLLLLALPGGARADPAGTADGRIELDGRPTALTHAYVIEVNELPEMHFGDGPTRYFSVMLTDRPFPDGRTPSDMAAHQLAFAGELRGIGLEVDPASGEVMSGRTLLPAAERPQYFTVITMGAEPMVVLEDWAEAGGRLHGQVRTPEPLEVVNFDGGPGPTAFTFHARFDAAIVLAPKVTEELTGEAARQSPPIGALRSFIEAVAAKDLDAVRNTLADGDQMREDLTAEDLEMMSAMMFETAGTADGLLARLSKVYLFDDETAVAVLVHGPDEASTFPLMRHGGAWKLGRP